MQSNAAITERAPINTCIDALREADRLVAFALTSLARGDLERDTGLPAEFVLRLEGRRTGWDARELTAAADALRQMPRTAEALGRQEVSWSQLRAILRTMRDARVTARGPIDQVVGARAAALAGSDPEQLLREVDDACAALRADLERRREDRAIETSYLVLRPRLEGGGSLYGEADAESFAAIAEALDAAADRPSDDAAQDDDATSRARQRMDALVRVCEAALSGSPADARPRPRLIATVDADATRLLWRLPGAPPRLSPLATEILRCDAEVIPVVFDGATPIEVGHARATVSARARTAVLARDRGCRFPGCDAPAAWSDVHHISWRAAGGGNELSNLIMLCRRCHRRVHRYRWRIALQADGTFDFRCRGRRYTSPPPRRRE